MKKLQRPLLNEIPLSEVKLFRGTVTITMSVGQWDRLLEESYKRGWIILELDDSEKPVAAYQNPSIAVAE